MKSTALLENIAQIAVGLGGYASVVSVFSSKPGDLQLRRWRIRVMICTSALAIMFALLPLMLEQFNLQGRMLWSSSGVLLALGILGQVVMTFRWMPPTYRKSYFSKPVALWILFFSVLACVLVLAAAVTGEVQISMPFYLMVLIYLLFLSGYHFIRIVLAEFPIQ